MWIIPAEPPVFTVGSALSRFSGFFYQCYLLPLLLAMLVLSLTSDHRSPGRIAVQVVCGGLAGAILYLLCAAALRGDFTEIGTVSHFLMLSLLVLYAAFLCPMKEHVKVVVTAAIVANINFAQSVSTQMLMPVLPMNVSNLVQFLLLLVSLAVIYIFRPSRADDDVPTAYWLSMLAIAVLSTACLYTIRILGGRSLYIDRSGYLTTSVVLCAFYLVNLLIYYLYYTLVREHRARASMAAMQAKLQQDLEFYRRSETLTEEYRSLRHELKNHISLMESLLREEKYDELRKYFAEYAGKITPQLAEFRCPNPLVTSVITHQMNTALAAGVSLDVIAAVPETLGIADDDLCSLLSNMLDNGVEGCLRAGKSLVKATLHTDKGCLFVTVTNPADEAALRDNPDLRTTKDNAESHGFGIPILRSIAAKYDGIVSFRVEDGWFTADAMLYMEGD